MLWALPREDRSLEEDRFEILTELLDKSCQGLEIWEEHCVSLQFCVRFDVLGFQERKIPLGHRCVLEGELIHLITSKFDLIDKICGEFDKLKNKRSEVNDERDVSLCSRAPYLTRKVVFFFQFCASNTVFSRLFKHFNRSFIDF